MHALDKYPFTLNTCLGLPNFMLSTFLNVLVHALQFRIRRFLATQKFALINTNVQLIFARLFILFACYSFPRCNTYRAVWRKAVTSCGRQYVSKAQQK